MDCPLGNKGTVPSAKAARDSPPTGFRQSQLGFSHGHGQAAIRGARRWPGADSPFLFVSRPLQADTNPGSTGFHVVIRRAGYRRPGRIRRLKRRDRRHPPAQYREGRQSRQGMSERSPLNYTAPASRAESGIARMSWYTGSTADRQETTATMECGRSWTCSNARPLNGSRGNAWPGPSVG